jgi:hypothetical protein
MYKICDRWIRPERGRLRYIQISMRAIIETCREDLALLEEYRVALHDWAAARAADPLDSQAPAVREATKRIEELERKLKESQLE